MAIIGINGVNLPNSFQELQEKRLVEMQNQFPQVDLNDGSVIRAIKDPITQDEYELLRAIEKKYQGQNIRVAEGKDLEDLVLLSGLIRQQPSPSLVRVECRGAVNTQFFQDARVSSINGDQFLVVQPTTLLNVNTVFNLFNVIPEDNKTYSIQVSGFTFQYTSGVEEAAEDIVNGLKSVINDGEYVFEAKNVDNKLAIEVKQKRLDVINVVAGSGLELEQIGVLVNFQSQENGEIPVLANTVNQISTPVAGLQSVNNPFGGQLGRELETDEELRARFFAGSNQSISTAFRIQREVGQIEGVSFVVVATPNHTAFNLDAGTIEVVVRGGDGLTIANTIWQYKSDGSKTIGNTAFTIPDALGYAQTIFFSRPELVFLWLKIQIEGVTSNQQAIQGLVINRVQEYISQIQIGQPLFLKRLGAVIIKSDPQIEDAIVSQKHAPQEFANIPDEPADPYSFDNITLTPRQVFQPIQEGNIIIEFVV